MDENNNAVETEELGDIDYFEGWDDDPVTEDGADEADETEATEEQQDQQPEEAAEKPSQEDTAEQPEPKSWKLKHNGEELDADEAKMVELAQKGLDYDRVRGERDTFKSEHPKYADYEKFLQEMAEEAGTDVPGLMENVRVSLMVKKAKAEGKTLSEAAAIQQVRREATARTTPEKAEPTEQPKEQSEETRRRETIRVFCVNHPTVKAEDIPQEVLQEGISSGDLSGAYDRWEIKQLKEKLGDAQRELETIKQNQKNKERSTGSKRSSSSVSADPWFEGWPDD